VQRRAPGADGRHGRRGAGQRGRGDVGALVDEQVHAVGVPVQRRQVERRHAAAGRPVHELAAAVAAGACQQQARALDVAARRRQVQRRPAAQAVHLGHLFGQPPYVYKSNHHQLCCDHTNQPNKLLQIAAIKG